MLGEGGAFQALLSNRKEGKLAQKREPNVPKNSRVSSSLEPVKHLSVRLQHKLVKRASRQLKRFRSSGEPYPLAMDMPGTESGPTAASSLTTGQRVALAIASLVVVMLLTLGLVAIAAATHAASGIAFLILILVVVALFTSAAVIVNILLNRKP